jgi:membrane-bound lytic murein transglycosylase B
MKTAGAIGGVILALSSDGAFADYSNHPKTPELLNDLRQDYGFSETEIAVVRRDLADAEMLPKLIQSEVKNKEVTAPNWDYYRPIHVNAANIRNGLRYLHENRAWFAKAEAQYGVPPSVVAGILGVETKYGTYTGKFRVLDALATQGFDHPTRQPFFFSELTQLFVYCRDSGRDAETLYGSYAGAMGNAQFMPSNIRSLAVDFDGDGRRDLWTGPDAIGSIANYLTHYDSTRAFRRGEPLVVPARLSRALPDDFPRNGRRATQTVAQLRAAGIKPDVELPDTLPAGLIELRRTSGLEYWVALPNFYAVQTYNPRIFYAMAVTQLAGELAKGETAAVAAETAAASGTAAR